MQQKKERETERKNEVGNYVRLVRIVQCCHTAAAAAAAAAAADDDDVDCAAVSQRTSSYHPPAVRNLIN